MKIQRAAKKEHMPETTEKDEKGPKQISFAHKQQDEEIGILKQKCLFDRIF
jgi:hypothetical protein